MNEVILNHELVAALPTAFCDGGHLQERILVALRDDKDPRKVVRET